MDSYIEVNGKNLLVANGWNPSTGKLDGNYGILVADLKDYWNKGMGVQIAQLYELVIPGLVLSKHVFQGLKRRLYCDDDDGADKNKLIFSRLPAFDVEINRGQQAGSPKIVKCKTPKEKTFVVIISPNYRHREEYPTIDGWIDRWNWVTEDSGLPEAPENWVDRYDKKIYSRV